MIYRHLNDSSLHSGSPWRPSHVELTRITEGPLSHANVSLHWQALRAPIVRAPLDSDAVQPRRSEQPSHAAPTHPELIIPELFTTSVQTRRVASLMRR